MLVILNRIEDNRGPGEPKDAQSQATLTLPMLQQRTLEKSGLTMTKIEDRVEEQLGNEDTERSLD